MSWHLCHFVSFLAVAVKISLFPYIGFQQKPLILHNSECTGRHHHQTCCCIHKCEKCNFPCPCWPLPSSCQCVSEGWGVCVCVFTPALAPHRCDPWPPRRWAKPGETVCPAATSSQGRYRPHSASFHLTAPSMRAFMSAGPPYWFSHEFISQAGEGMFHLAQRFNNFAEVEVMATCLYTAGFRGVCGHSMCMCCKSECAFD